jgi:hypothetical protein
MVDFKSKLKQNNIMATTDKKGNTAEKPAAKEKKSALDSILDQYESNKSSGTSDYEKVDLTKYFTDKLQKDQASDERTIRILPSKDDTSPFKEGFWHEMQVGGKWTKIYCNDLNDDKHCPLCEVEEALRMTGDAKDKELAKQYKPKKFYIVKVIHREKEEEGVKFYRFKHNWSNDGVFDKLTPIFRKKGDISDPRSGRDITLTIGRDQNKNAKVTTIQAEDVSILTDDKDKAKLWYNDASTWKDVYKPKDLRYVEIVAKQQKPVWDKDAKCFVSEDEYKAKESVSLDDEIKISKTELASKKPTDKKTVSSTEKTKPKFELKTSEEYDGEDESPSESDVVEESEEGKDDMPF